MHQSATGAMIGGRARATMAISTVPAHDRDAHRAVRRLGTATFAGWAVGLVLGIAAIVIVESIGFPPAQFPLALGMGAGVGLLQARALSRDVPRRRAWLLATALGLAAPFILVDASNLAGRPLPFSLAAYVGLGGLVAGTLQWRLLRRSCDRARWWLVASPLAWLLAASTVWVNERLLPKTPGLVGAVQYLSVVLAGGIVLGVLSAAALHAARGGASPSHMSSTGS